MNRSFRQFMKHQYFPCSIHEQEAAPSIGSAPPTPGNPDNTSNAHHFDAMQQEFGIDDDDMTAALEGEPIQIWKVPDYSSKWGFVVAGPCSAIVKKRTDGSFDVTFQLSIKKLMNPKSFILPYKEGDRPIRYEGSVSDQTVTMSAEELQDIMAMPFEQGGAPAGMGGPAMGGMPPAGGPPPMGAPAPAGPAPMGGM